MADFMYDGAREDFAAGNLDWDAHTFKLVLLSADYVASSADNYLSDIASPARVAVSPALASKTNVAGVLDAADVTIPWASFLSTTAVTQFVVYRDTGVESTSRLLFHVDSYVGLPYTPLTGVELRIELANDANKLARI